MDPQEHEMQTELKFASEPAEATEQIDSLESEVVIRNGDDASYAKREKLHPLKDSMNEETERETSSISKIEFSILKKLVLFEVGLMLFDMISDLCIVVSLYKESHFLLSFIGLFIDILPGLVTTLYMASNGYGFKSLSLLIHPWNVIWHCFWSFWSKAKEDADFHKRIFLFAKACQGLLESPLQIIFTLTLIAHGILQLPWKKEVRIQVEENSVDLSMLLSISFIFSLLVIIKDFTETASSMENSIKSTLISVQKFLTWIAYFSSAILFRLEVWVLLLVYFIEWTVPLIFGLMLLDLAIIWFLHRGKFTYSLVFDSIMSIIFPTSFTSTTNIENVEEGRLFMRRVHVAFGISGNIILCKYILHC